MLAVRFFEIELGMTHSGQNQKIKTCFFTPALKPLCQQLSTCLQMISQKILRDLPALISVPFDSLAKQLKVLPCHSP